MREEEEPASWKRYISAFKLLVAKEAGRAEQRCKAAAGRSVEAPVAAAIPTHRY
jgi:hypothetical protein